MIVTITLNPAVDKTCEIGRIIPGEVNRIRTTSSVAGGKGINVAKIFRQFHLPCAAMGFLGGPGGRLIEEAMIKMGAECHFTRIKDSTRTNTNIIADDGYVTELLEPGPVISERELGNFNKEFEYCLEDGEPFIMSGSVPGGVPTDIYASLIEKCRAEKRKVFLDTSGEFLREGIKAKPYFIKPNKKELEYICGRKLNDRDDVIYEAKKLNEYGIEKVVVSLGTGGLLYVDRENVIYEPAKKVKTLNTVGCGDSVVASFVMSEAAGEDVSLAMKKAAALAAANATTIDAAVIPMTTYLDLLGE
jgi:tagatose 6-phosphate kinase